MSALRGRSELFVLAMLVSFLLGLYAAVYAWLPSGSVWGGDQGMKFLQIEALAGDPPRLALRYAGAGLAPEARFSPFRRSHAVQIGADWYSVFPVAYAALNVPPYRSFGFGGLYVIPALAVACLAVFAYRLARRYFGVGEALAATLIGTLASPLVVYGAVLWEHALAVALSTGAVLLLVPARDRGSPRALLAAGALVGVSIWLRSELYVFAAAAAAALLICDGNARRVSWFAAGVVGGLIPLWCFNALLYGDPAGPHLSYNFTGASDSFAIAVSRHVASRVAIARDLMPLREPLWWAAVGSGVVGILVAAVRPARGRVALACVSLSCAIAATAAVRDFQAGSFVANLLAGCPWIVLLAALPSADAADAETRSLRFPVLLVVGYIALVLAFSPVPGGVQWGGRILLPVVPLLAILAVSGRARMLRRIDASSDAGLRSVVGIATAAVLVVGVLVQVGGMRSLYTFKQRNFEYNRAIVQTGDRIFVTSARWPALAAAPVWNDRIFLRANNPEDFCTLVSRFSRAGIERFTYLAVPTFVQDVSRGSCAAESGYRIEDRTTLRTGSVIRGIHFGKKKS